MGCTRVFQWTNGSETASVSDLSDRVRLLGGSSLGPFAATCRIYRGLRRPGADGDPPQSLYVVSFSDRPGKVYSCVDQSVVEAGPELEAVVSKQKNLWAHRQTASVEGFAYRLDDFVIRAGAVYANSIYKGILAEVEFLPLISPLIPVSRLFSEFLESAFPPGAAFSPPTYYRFDKLGLSGSKFSPAHTSFQYIQVLKQMV